MADEEVLPLDSDLIKVLASDSRRDILRHLQERPMTVTELSRALDLRKATVSEHLKKLTESGLVTRRDDERLWVYYELSRSGKRIVNPGRTRFYLVVSAAVVAGIAALVMASLFLFTGPADDVAAPDALNVEIGDGRAYAGAPVSFQAFVQGPDGRPVAVDAYLLTPEEAQALAQGDSAAVGTPLVVQGQGVSAEASMVVEEDADATAQRSAAGDGAEGAMDAAEAPFMEAAAPSPFVSLSSGTPLEPGTYFLYVRDPEGRDNRLAMPAITVAPIHVQVTPSTWWKGLDDAATLTALDSPGDLSATVELVRLGDTSEGGEPVTLRMANATAHLNASTLDALAPGGYEVRLLPDGQRTWQRTGDVLTVREPQVAVLPRQTLETSHLTLQLTVLAGERALEDVPVRIDGNPVNTTVAGADQLAVDVGPAGPGTLAVQVGRLTPTPVRVHPVLAPTFEAIGGGQLRVTVAGPDDAPPPGVGVLLDDAVVGFTNATGQLELPVPASGRHRLGLQSPDGERVERAIDVDGWNVTEAPSALELVATAAPARPGTGSLTVAVSNAGPASEPATLVARLEGRAVAAETIELAPGANASRTLTVHVNREGPLELVVEALGLSQRPLAFVNRTAPAPNGEGAPPLGGDAGDTAPPTGTTIAATPPQGTPVHLVVEDLATEAPPVDVGGTQQALLAERLAEDEAAATPFPGALAVLVVAAVLAAFAARRRRG